MSETVKLAKKLGLIRYKKLDGSSSSGQTSDKKTDSGRKLSHVLVIDFESTCWEERVNVPPQEIIEFPVVLVSLTTGSVVSEFHQYCQPVEQPRLSPFCRQLTGISQDTVDDGLPLATCLVLFRQWIDSVTREHGLVFMGSSQETEEANLVTCVTWSDWDLSVCLENECRRKQIRKPDCFNSWIDIRAVYRTFYNRRPHGLNNAMREIGLSFEGREHSGIEDARNTAKLVVRMFQSGCPLSITATRDENSSTLANTAHRKYSTNKDEEPSGRRSKWKHFKPDPGPRLMEGISSAAISDNSAFNSPANRSSDKREASLDSTFKTPDKKRQLTLTSLISSKRSTASPNDSGYDSPQFVPPTPPIAHVSATPPLCGCGRRSRKRQVYKVGPNTGRIFWSCALKGRNTTAGCNFFLWATTD